MEQSSIGFGGQPNTLANGATGPSSNVKPPVPGTSSGGADNLMLGLSEPDQKIALSNALVRELLSPAPRELLALEGELLILQGQYLFHWRDHQKKTEHYKFISPQAARSAFGQQSLDSGWLPPGIARWGDGPQGRWFVQFIPPGSYYTLKLELPMSNSNPELATTAVELPDQTTTLTVPLPGLVLAGNGTSYYLWAIKEKEFDPKAEVYQPPLPNLYANGAICFGTNHPPAVAWETLEQVWQLFLTSPFNAHLVQHKSRRHPDDVRKQLQKLAHSNSNSKRNRKKYPLADLIPIALNSHHYPNQAYQPKLTITTAIETLVMPKSSQD